MRLTLLTEKPGLNGSGFERTVDFAGRLRGSARMRYQHDIPPAGQPVISRADRFPKKAANAVANDRAAKLSAGHHAITVMPSIHKLSKVRCLWRVGRY